MIWNKYKIEKKSPLELKAEAAQAKAADLRDSLQSNLEDARATGAKKAKKAAKRADKNTARAQKKANKAAGKAQSNAKGALAAAAGAVAGVAATAQDRAQPLVDVASDKAAPVVDKAHDTFVDEIMPRITDALAGIAASASAAKDAAADKAAPVVDQANERLSLASDRTSDAYAVLKGDKVARSKGNKSGTALMVLGLLAAAAAAALTAYKQMQPQDDPWATPLLDPYTPPTAGRDSSTGTVAFSNDTAGTNAELSPAEQAQGGDAQSILQPVEDQTYAANVASDAERAPADDGAGELLNPLESFDRDENGRVIGDGHNKTY